MSKRDRDGTMRPKDGGKPGPAIPETRFTPMFTQFRDELDEHYDRKERIVKASRDVTALSKKMVNKLGPLPKRTQDEIDSRMSEIKSLLTGLEPDLTSLNRYRYAHSLRCLEELVEALSFSHYLRTQTLIGPEETSTAVPAAISLTEEDYLYGIFDLFGEMMRFATVTTAQSGELAGGEVAGAEGSEGDGGDGSGAGRKRRRDILQDFHELSGAFEVLPEIHDRTYRGKMEAMRTSVRKVEKLGYGIAIRGSERPRGWLPDMKDDVEPVAGD